MSKILASHSFGNYDPCFISSRKNFKPLLNFNVMRLMNMKFTYKIYISPQLWFTTSMVDHCWLRISIL